MVHGESDIKDSPMPLTFTLTENILPAGKEKDAFQQLSAAMLRWHGLEGNGVMTPNVVGSIHLLPLSNTMSGGTETPVVFIEWKVPSFAFSTQEIRSGYFDEATTIIHGLSDGQHPRDRVFINVVHTVDGAWNMDGRAMTDAELLDRIAQG